MSEQSLQLSSRVGGGTELREYATLWVVLAAALTVQAFASTALTRVRGGLVQSLGPRLTGAVVYTVVLLCVLAAGYAVARQWSAAVADTEAETLFTLVGVAAFVLFTGTYWLHGAADLPEVPTSVVGPFVTGGLGMAGLAVVGARVLDRPLRLSRPDSSTVVVAVGTAIATALVGVVRLVVFALQREAVFYGSAVGLGGPDLTAATLLWDVAVPALFLGAGMGLLYFAVVQESLSRLAGPVHAIAGVTALFGTTWWLLAVFGPDSQPLDGLLAPALAALVGLLAARAAVFLLARVESVRGATPWPVVGVLVGLVVLLPLFALAAGIRPTAGLLLTGASLGLVVGVVAIGYDHTRSAWVPVAGMVAYMTVTSAELSRLVVLAVA